MKTRCFFVLLFCLTQSSLAIAELPPIAPGLWEITSDQGGKEVKTKHCMDKDTMKKMLEKSNKMLGGSCSAMEFKQTGAKSFISSVDCTMMNSKVSINSQITGIQTVGGDFSEYESKTTTKFDPPMMGQAGGSSTDKAVRLAAKCPDGMQPGDVQFADGKTINTHKMMKEMPDIGKMMGTLESGKEPDPAELQKLMDQVKKMQEMQQN